MTNPQQPAPLQEASFPASQTQDELDDGDTTVGSGGPHNDEEEQKLAVKETKAVNFGKSIVLLVLVVSCAVASVLTFVFTRKGQENDFSTEFNSIASEMIEVTKHNSETVFDVIRQFSLTTTSFALYNRQQRQKRGNHSDSQRMSESFTDYGLQQEVLEGNWPFSTLPDFEARSTVFREVTRAQFLAVLPMVWPEEREAWGAYSVAHQGWIQESREYNELHGGDLHHSGHGALGETNHEGHDDHANHGSEHSSHSDHDSHHDNHSDEDEGHHDGHAEAADEKHHEHSEMHDEEHDAHVSHENEHNEHSNHHNHYDDHSEGVEGHHDGHTEEANEHHDDHSGMHDEGHNSHANHAAGQDEHSNYDAHHDSHPEEAEAHDDGHSEAVDAVTEGEHGHAEESEAHHDNHMEGNEAHGLHAEAVEESESGEIINGTYVHYFEHTDGTEVHHDEHEEEKSTGVDVMAEDHAEMDHSGHYLRRRLEDPNEADHHDTSEHHEEQNQDHEVHHDTNSHQNEGPHHEESDGEHSHGHDAHRGDQQENDGHHGHDGHHGAHHGGATTIPEHIYRFQNSVPVPENTPSFSAPLWQAGPLPPDISLVNFNFLSIPLISRVFNSVLQSRLPVLSEVLDLTEVFSEAGSQAFVEHLHGEEAGEIPHPESLVLQPIFDDFGEEPEIKGALLVALPWNVFFDNLLSERASVICVVKNKCGQVFSYRIEGSESYFLGRGDKHDTKFDKYERVTDFTEFDDVEFRVANDAHNDHHGGEQDKAEHDVEEMRENDRHNAKDVEHHEHGDVEDHADDEHRRVAEEEPNHNRHHAAVGSCDYTLHIFPTQELEEKHESNKPLLFSLAVILFFVFTSSVFILYDCLVERRQKKVLKSANRTGAIVQSLFPKVARDQMFESEKEARSGTAQADAFKRRISSKGSMSLEEVTETRPGSVALRSSKPIANLFHETTIFFADLAGFTSFSATRTPVEVFTLLETIYNSFDQIAKRRRVFKVETIGDCYVAVTGLPMPQKNHAVIMARFANDCLHAMGDCTHSLIDVLGPDTTNLKLRVGLHSGPTTGGVLRGEKGRFQLFGDTVNTAARMESNGIPGKIQVSEATADRLVAAGKSAWITPREDKINAKGKGVLSTWWLNVQADKRSSDGGISRSGSIVSSDEYNQAVLEEIFTEHMVKQHNQEEEKGSAAENRREMKTREEQPQEQALQVVNGIQVSDVEC